MENDMIVTLSSASITPVDPDSPIPLYYQIESDLRRLISSGEMPPGATIPPELELCQLYGVGRHTMRMALSRLSADNLITRRAGRGTIVRLQTDRIQFYLDRSFTRQMAELGRRAHSQVLEITSGEITADDPDVFLNKIGAPCLRLVRLRLGDEEPIGLQATTILTERCPDLAEKDFDRGSLYDILASEYQLVIAELRHTIRATTADEFQAEMLQVTDCEPLLVVNSTAFLDNRQVIEHTISHYRADRYEYSTTHTYTPQSS